MRYIFQILLDGISLKDLNLKWLRNQIGVVAQEPVLFSASIAENIRYGRPDVSEDDMVEAARMANAHFFISKLPDVSGFSDLFNEKKTATRFWWRRRWWWSHF